MKKQLNLFKYIFLITCIVSCFVAVAIGLCKWIISTTIETVPIEITGIQDDTLTDILESVDYDGNSHKPHESLDTFVAENYSITYYNSSDEQIGFGSLYSGPTNAGTYKVKYENNVNHVISIVLFKINSIKPVIFGERMYYTPNIDDYNLIAKGIDEDILDGNWNKEFFNINTSDYISSTSEGKDSHYITIKCKFSPNNSNYYEVEENINFPLYSVAYNGSSYYSRIENALYKSSSGTVNIIFATNPVIYGFEQNDGSFSTTIKSGVTLYLNYNSSATKSQDKAKRTSNGIVKFDGTKQIPAEHPNGWDYDTDPCLVYVEEGVNILNNGVLTIGGELSAAPFGPRNGHTSGDYTVLLMKDNSSIVSTGQLNCYGFIYEYCGLCEAYPYSQKYCSECSNVNCNVIFEGGILKVPYVIKDMGDGSCITGFKASTENEGYTAPPFNLFSFENISANVTIKYGTTVNAIVNIYAASLSMIQEAVVKLVSSGDEALIQLNEGSYFTTKYDLTTTVTKYNFYGDVNINSMDVNINAVIMSISINTKVCYLPLSWQFDVSFNCLEIVSSDGSTSTKVPATVECAQMFKMMPGAILKINEGVTFNASTIFIYEEYTDNAIMAKTRYPSTKDPALLCVGGILNVDNLGGEVKSISPNAVLNIIESNQSISYEALNCFQVGATTISQARITDWAKYSKYSALMLGTKNNNNIYRDKIGEYKSTLRKYTYNNEEYHYWGYYDNISLEFNCGLNGVSVDSIIIENVFFDKVDFELTLDIDYIPTNNKMNDLASHYYFINWTYNYGGQNICIDQNTTEIVINGNTTFYASWNPTEYNIIIGGYKYEGCEEVGNITDEEGNDFKIFNTNKFTIETEQPLNIPIHSKNYVFGGWYLDNNCSGTQITAIKGEDYVSFEQITLYGLWYPEGTDTYTLNYLFDYPDGYSNAQIQEIFNIFYTTSSSVLSVNINNYSMPMNCFSQNNNTNFSSYFIGWYDSNDNLLGNSSTTNDELNNNIRALLTELHESNDDLDDNSKVKTLNITGKWGSKSEVTVIDYRTSTKESIERTEKITEYKKAAKGSIGLEPALSEKQQTRKQEFNGKRTIETPFDNWLSIVKDLTADQDAQSIMKKIRKILAFLWAIGLLLFSNTMIIQAEEYEYDMLNRVTKVIYEDGSYVQYEYDKNGNIVNIHVSDVKSGEGKEENDKNPPTESEESAGEGKEENDENPPTESEESAGEEIEEDDKTPIGGSGDAADEGKEGETENPSAENEDTSIEVIDKMKELMVTIVKAIDGIVQFLEELFKSIFK